MRAYARVLHARYVDAFGLPGFWPSTLAAMALFAGALFVNFWAIGQATKRASSSVEDIILSNIPVFEVDGFLVYGTLLAIVFTVAVLLSQPKRIPFSLHALTLFVVIRSAFVLMTHLGAPETTYASDFGETITKAFFGADQFFSAHTGMPFLGALAFWRIDRSVAYAFLGIALSFAAIVLLGHIHYTIDVASAFFITYGIFEIAKWLLPRDWALFSKND